VSGVRCAQVSGHAGSHGHAGKRSGRIPSGGPGVRRPAVEVAHLRKTYGTLVAVDDVSFTVAEGEIFGILGPNGAGKTTAIECAIGLRRPDAGEILEEYRSFYRDPADVAELLDVLGLAAKRGDYYRSLSGGQRQRLSIALALIGRPRIAVLDEMTTGLDPQARRDTWELIEHAAGVTARDVQVVVQLCIALAGLAIVSSQAGPHRRAKLAWRIWPVRSI
jgi:ABC-type multidrug transport system ATPase subunit